MAQQYPVPITYISDCRDDNTKGRLKTRVSTLFPGSNVIFVGVDSDLEAGINLVDIIDAYDGQPGIILANVARREGKERKQKWQNGTPFGHFKYGNLDIFTTIDGYILSLLKKVTKENITVQVYDIPKVVPHMGLDEETQDRIIHTQFRSFDYLPRLAAAIMAGQDLPFEEFTDIPEVPLATCWVDSFGNIKTNILPEEVKFEIGKSVIIRVSVNKQLRLPCYNRLKDIPDGTSAITIGSSGYGNKRFCEIMLQGKSAAYALGVGSGALMEYVETVD
jgi:hypothetical protein